MYNVPWRQAPLRPARPGSVCSRRGWGGLLPARGRLPRAGRASPLDGLERPQAPGGEAAARGAPRAARPVARGMDPGRERASPADGAGRASTRLLGPALPRECLPRAGRGAGRGWAVREASSRYVPGAGETRGSARPGPVCAGRGWGGLLPARGRLPRAGRASPLDGLGRPQAPGAAERQGNSCDVFRGRRGESENFMYNSGAYRQVKRYPEDRKKITCSNLAQPAQSYETAPQEKSSV